MKIEVLKTTKAASCPLGIETKNYIAGEVYEIFDELAEVFIKEGFGKKTIEAKAKAIDSTELENKAIDSTELENKAIESAPQNKGIKNKKAQAEAN
jgi:hypothetical protein